jgi:protein-tyrosine kinase
MNRFDPSQHAPESLDAEQSSLAVHRQIGSIIAESRDLPARDVERILSHQKDKGLRFGEAAVELGYASKDDVLFALAQQFHYPYAQAEKQTVSPELVALTKPFSPQAESFRAIRSQLTMRVFGEPQTRRALAVVSPDTGDGKSYFAANLAVTLAQLGGRTLLLDADLRGPRQHEIFGLTGSGGLSGVLSGRSQPNVIQYVQGIPSLFVMPVGVKPPNPLELVERPAFALLMQELTGKFDHVVVDTPAAVFGADYGVIASRCGSALVIARRHASRVNSLQEMVAGMSHGSTMLAGVIFNEY